MATMTIEITDDLKERLDREVASGRFKDQSAAVQLLLEAAMQAKRKEDAEKKIVEALAEVERGEVVPWKKGNCVKMGLEYLRENAHVRRNRNGDRAHIVVLA